MKPKYLQAEINRLETIQKGVNANPERWVGLPVTATDISNALSKLNVESNELQSIEVSLKKSRLKAHETVNELALVYYRAEKLARGIHVKEPEKLAEYGLTQSNRGNGAQMPIPGKAVIVSIKDDKSGDGFILKVQKLPNSTDFEIWRGQSANPDALVLEPATFTFLAITKKLEFRDEALQKGRRYFYRIRGFNRNGKGEWSSAVNRMQ